MTRPMLFVMVGLASYGALSLVMSAIAVAVWRSGLVTRGAPAAVDLARRLVGLRATPVAVPALLTLTFVMPAFAWFEPVRTDETAGPILLGVAIGTATLIAASMMTAIRIALTAHRFESQWRQSAIALAPERSTGVPVFAVEWPAPFVALAGIVSPALLAARHVVEACTPEEFATIVAHERGHLHARDNLKRWLMACAPDPLRWTRVHQQIVNTWHDAAEDAADDAATGTDPHARLDLAALLLKISRLTTLTGTPASISPFVQPQGLDRRVRRLLSTHSPRPGPSIAIVPIVAAAATIALIVTLDARTFEQIYNLVEALVGLGR